MRTHDATLDSSVARSIFGGRRVAHTRRRHRSNDGVSFVWGYFVRDDHDQRSSRFNRGIFVALRRVCSALSMELFLRGAITHTLPYLYSYYKRASSNIYFLRLYCGGFLIKHKHFEAP